MNIHHYTIREWIGKANLHWKGSIILIIIIIIIKINNIFNYGLKEKKLNLIGTDNQKMGLKILSIDIYIKKSLM